METYPLLLWAVEKLGKQSMFQDANNSLSEKVSRTFWETIHRILKYQAPLYGSFVKEAPMSYV